MDAKLVWVALVFIKHRRNTINDSGALDGHIFSDEGLTNDSVMNWFYHHVQLRVSSCASDNMTSYKVK